MVTGCRGGCVVAAVATSYASVQRLALTLPAPRPPCASPADGLGAAFGILAACGVKIPKPNSLQWELAIRLNGALAALDRLLGRGGQ